MDRYILVNRIIDKEGSAEVCEAYTSVSTLLKKWFNIIFEAYANTAKSAQRIRFIEHSLRAQAEENYSSSHN